MSSRSLPTKSDRSTSSAAPGELWCPCLRCSTEAYRKKVTRNTLLSHTGLRPGDLKRLEEGDEIGLFQAYLAARIDALDVPQAPYQEYREFIWIHPNITPITDEIPPNIDATLKRARALSSLSVPGSSSDSMPTTAGSKRRRVDTEVEVEPDVSFYA